MFRSPLLRDLTGAAVVSVPTVGVPPQVGSFVRAEGVGLGVSKTIKGVGWVDTGFIDGDTVGFAVGATVGFFVGLTTGDKVGFLDGEGVGSPVAGLQTSMLMQPSMPL